MYMIFFFCQTFNVYFKGCLFALGKPTLLTQALFFLFLSRISFANHSCYNGLQNNKKAPFCVTRKKRDLELVTRTPTSQDKFSLIKKKSQYSLLFHYCSHCSVKSCERQKPRASSANLQIAKVKFDTTCSTYLINLKQHKSSKQKHDNLKKTRKRA